MAAPGRDKDWVANPPLETDRIQAAHADRLVRLTKDHPRWRDLQSQGVEVMGRSCRGNPLLDFILGTYPGRQRRERHYFAYMVRSGRRYGTVFLLLNSEGRVYGLGMMARDSKRLYSLPWQLAAGALELVWGCGLPTVWRSLVYEQAVGRIRRKMLPENHLYGYFLAIEPGSQRDSFRSARFLMEGCRLWAREQGLTFYFETMSDRHRIYYEKHGFRPSGHFRFEAAGLDFYSMEER